MKTRQDLKTTKRWVVKIGSALLTNRGTGLDRSAIAVWVEQMIALRNAGIEVLLVSSGAVAEGCQRLGWKTRPKALHDLQAVAAMGQMGLVQAYEACFQEQGLHTAQILLTHEDLSNRQRYLNARSTLRTLIGLGVVPVINENDTVATEEFRFGDNDTLAALVANLVGADLLVILTDQKGLYNTDPQSNPNAKLVDIAMAHEKNLLLMAGGSSSSGLGRGGMLTKVKAARLAARSGTATVIAPGADDQVLSRIHMGEQLGTLILPDQGAIAARKQWLASHLKVRGCLTLDAGAVKVLRNSGRSLLAVGVVGVEGNFARGELVSCVDESGAEVAKGLVNYGSDEAAMIMGKPSNQIEGVLGYVDDPELIHRDNLVVV